MTPKLYGESLLNSSKQSKKRISDVRLSYLASCAPCQILSPLLYPLFRVTCEEFASRRKHGCGGGRQPFGLRLLICDLGSWRNLSYSWGCRYVFLWDWGRRDSVEQENSTITVWKYSWLGVVWLRFDLLRIVSFPSFVGYWPSTWSDSVLAWPCWRVLNRNKGER